MLSLFTALFTNAMQASLDGTRCRDIGGKDVSNPNTHALNPLQSYSMHMLHTVLYEFLKVPMRTIFLTIKSSLSW